MKIKPGNLLKIAVSLAVLIVVIANVGAERLWDQLRAVDLRWFGLAFAIHLLGVVIRAYRWWLLIASLGAPVPFRRLVYLYFAGTFFSTFLPTGIGGDVVKIVELAPDRGGAQAFSTVFADRLTGLLGSSLIALVIALLDPADVSPQLRLFIIAVTGGILAGALLLTQGRALERLVGRTRSIGGPPPGGRLRQLFTALTSYSVGAIARSTLVSLPFTAALIATQVALSIALGLRIDVRYFVLFTPIVALTQLLPISFNGLGVREGAYGALFVAAEVDASAGVAISLLYYVVRVLTGLLGGLAYLAGNLRGADRAASGSRPPAAVTRFVSPINDYAKIQLLRLNQRLKPTDVFIISYPKSGRTWLRVLVGKAICLKYGVAESLMLRTHKLTAAAGLPSTRFIHDYSEILSELPYYRLPTDKSDYARSKVIFVSRDVKDVLVSSYFQATRRTNKFRGPISDFIRSDKFGVRKVVTFYNIWHRNRHIPRDFLLIAYEEMHADPLAALDQALRFIGVDGVDTETLRAAVAFASFGNMKHMEASGVFKDPKMLPGRADDAESFKVRKGVVGGYREYLSEDDIRYIDQVVAELGCPLAAQAAAP